MARPTNALIIDDEPHVRAFLRLLLQEIGINCTWEAANGATGLELVERHRPELILLDVNMPQVSGLEVLAKLAEDEITTPVVVITAQSSLSTVTEAMRLGAVGYILKHVAKEDTIGALNEIFDDIVAA